MSRSNKKKKYRYGVDNYWESAAGNSQLFYNFRDQIMNLALSRFKWVGLPPTCDERFLEYVLLTQGMATISYPRKQEGMFYSTQVVQQGKLNIYDNPTAWRSIGNNGWNFTADNTTGVIIYDNLTRFPLFPKLMYTHTNLSNLCKLKRIIANIKKCLLFLQDLKKKNWI